MNPQNPDQYHQQHYSTQRYTTPHGPRPSTAWHSGMEQLPDAQFNFFASQRDTVQETVPTASAPLRRSPRHHPSSNSHPSTSVRPPIQPIQFFGSIPVGHRQPAHLGTYAQPVGQPVDTSNLLSPSPHGTHQSVLRDTSGPADVRSEVDALPSQHKTPARPAKGEAPRVNSRKSSSASPGPSTAPTKLTAGRGKGRKAKGGAGSKSGPLNRRDAGLSDEEVGKLEADEAADAELPEDDPAVSGAEEEGRKWEEKDQLKAVEYVTNDAVYPALRVNASKVHRDVAQKVLNGRKTQTQVRNFLAVVWSKYTAVKRRERHRQKHTGGGDGDADNPLAPTFEGGDDEGVDSKSNGTRFSNAVLDTFERGPLFPLIDRVAKGEANVVRKREWSSGAAISDAEDEPKKKKIKTEDNDDSKDALSSLVASMKEKGKVETEIGRANLELQRKREEREERAAAIQEKLEEAREARAAAQERRIEAEFRLREQENKLALLERIDKLIASGSDADVVARAKKLLDEM